ncbi:MAG: hypothetical protein HN348_07990 [Proteobacteria bacterium]|jgi:predicted transcriptional regulator of viral defense system|nr:hypothetical protein [Pseudomonadota bacterium]
MHFAELLRLVHDEPLFETGLLLAGDVDQANIQRQLSRWTQVKKLIQVRRGLYAIAPPYQKRCPHPFLTANLLVRPSYVSLQSALAYHGLIPEEVPITTSVTSSRPAGHHTPLGGFLYRHVKPSWLWGSEPIEVVTDQTVWVASPEKALLDLIYLEAGADNPLFLEALRLQNLDLDMEKLATWARDSPKLTRAVGHIAHLAREEPDEEV